MQIRKRYPKTASIILGLPILFLLISLAFHFRSPVLLVVDQPFLSVYGEDRARYARLLLSAEALRPVVSVVVSSDSTPASASAAAWAALGGKVAACAVFPFWLEAAAREFSAVKPDIPVAVIQSWAMDGPDSSVPAGQTRIRYIVSDLSADAFKAGALAGRALPRDSKASIHVRVSLSFRERFADAFERGLASAHSSAVPIYSDPERQDFVAGVRPAFLVDAAPGSVVSDESSGTVPSLRFSWSDPRYAPVGVRWLFDDSPYALASAACASVRNGSDSAVPSRVLRVGAWFSDLF